MTALRRDCTRLLLCILIIWVLISVFGAFLRWYGDYAIANTSSTELCESIASGKIPFPLSGPDIEKMSRARYDECFPMLIVRFKSSDMTIAKCDTPESFISNRIYGWLADMPNSNFVRIYRDSPIFDQYDPELDDIYVLSAEKLIEAKEKAGVDYARMIKILVHLQSKGSRNSPVTDHVNKMLEILR